MHVRTADEAYAVGSARATDSYLSAANILGAARRAGADAVHPGYGFLAENAAFARAVQAAGLVWVGPNPEAIELMGDKISSRSAAARAGVPGVPGTDVPLSGPGEVVDFGRAHGWPVAVKAAFGGGGRGMRVVASEEEAAEALAAAQREAQAAFGQPACYLEKYLSWPRHVEVQVFADAQGNCVHLGTRDCSVQRRHQKLVEEAPAPDLPPEIADAMGRAAVDVARSCRYVNAGTVEFIYQDGEFYFLEMNTRIQVEHPVTELVTGLDLVGLQLLVAGGSRLPFAQDDICWQGHAIEARVNAEDPSGGRFTPSPGLITRLRPGGGPWVRTDAGYEAGDAVSQHYDNLLAKVVAWGPDRESARRRLLRALAETEVEGVATTIPAHLAVLAHDDFVRVEHSTTWLAQRVDLNGLGRGEQGQRGAGAAGGAGASAWREAEGRRSLEVEVNGRLYEVGVWLPPDYVALSGGADRNRAGEAGAPAVGPAPSTAAAPEVGRHPGAEAATITVPMQGTVVKVLVQVGDNVEQGQTICVLEAMKMENNIVAELAGTVIAVKVAPGASVGAGDVVAVLGPRTGQSVSGDD